MPYVVVDTNALMRDYLLIEANMQTFLQGSQRCHIAVCVPQIVIDELCANYEKEINRQKSTLHTAARKLLAMGVKVEATDFDVKEEAQRYRGHVHQMFEYHDAKVVPYPDISPKSLVDASYSGKKPFKESGEGFKDFIIFETIRAIATQQDDGGAFVTANKKDFCGSDGKLHPDLQSTLQQQLTVYDNIHDFNIAMLTPQLEVLDDIAERIRKSEFDGFDLNETLTACFIAELCDKYRRVEAPNSLVEDTTVVNVYTPATQDLTVNRLGENELLLGLTGAVELELSGFVPKVELYGIAQGTSDRLRCPVCSCAIFFLPFAHGTAGAARIRHSLLPHYFEGQRNANLGRLRRENADVYLLFEIRIGSRRRAVCKSTAVIDAFARRIGSQ